MPGRASIRRVESTFSVPAGLPTPSQADRMLAFLGQNQPKMVNFSEHLPQQTYSAYPKLAASLVSATRPHDPVLGV